MKMFIDTNEGTCSEQCIMLMFALLDDKTNNIKHRDIGLIFLDNRSTSKVSYDRDHERHFLLRVKDYYFDPLTNTFYDKAEASTLGLDSDHDIFKLRGLKDEYSVNKRLTLSKEALDIIRNSPLGEFTNTATCFDSSGVFGW